MKLLLERWKKFINEEKEEAAEKDVEGAARDLIDKEGGAIGRKMLKDPKELKPFLDKRGVELPEDFDLDAFIDEFIEGSKDIGVHDKKDIIAADGDEIKVTKEEIAEGIEFFLAEQDDLLDEKKKKKRAKRGPQSPLSERKRKQQKEMPATTR